ncbi:MAG: methyltransferase, TIGR04325 family [Phycisphaerae bacterium]|nr:methyltransferase, TIGR04325 family [Gemmatimonadaceae bacterium]
MSGRVHAVVEGLLSAPGVGAWRVRRFDAQFRAGHFVGAFRGVYPSYAAAAAAAPPAQPVGYDHDGPAGLYRERIDRVYPSDYAMMFWLGKILHAGATRVFDLGGHVGISYYAYQKYLQYPPTLSWEVLDVPAVAKAGRELAKQRDSAGFLTFVENTDSANDADVFFTAGCVQYMEPTLTTQIKALSRRPRWVLVNLLPLHETLEYWTLQSIDGAFCPYRVQRRAGFFEQMESLGYETLDRWENPEKGCAVKFEPRYDVNGYTGAVFRLR